MVAQSFELTKKGKEIYDENKKLLKRFTELFIIIRSALQENSGVCYVTRDFVSIHKKGLQSIR